MRWLLWVMVACSDPSPVTPSEPSGPVVSPPEPAPSTAPAAALDPPLEPLDAHRMRGPARSLCGVVRRLMDDTEVDCDLVWLRQRDEEGYIDVRETLAPAPPILAVHFVAIRFDPAEDDAMCGLLVRTEAGWFGHDVGELLCENSGSVRVGVTASLRWEAIGPAGEKRLVAEVREETSHFTDGTSDRRSVIICGERDQRMSCYSLQQQETFGVAPSGEGTPGRAWSVELHWQPGDRLLVGAHDAPEHPRRPPDPGLYEIRF
ncbi:MAG: hypothetical protein AAGE52_19145 [Myxococcota bacterium]